LAGIVAAVFTAGLVVVAIFEIVVMPYLNHVTAAIGAIGR
jgi:hypothetical protein